MSPRVKRPRVELPKTIVQKGTLGCFPLQDWSLSALYQERCGVVIGFRDSDETLLHKAKSQVQLVTPQDKISLDLNGKLFNGLSDALYRGRLPEVVLVCPPDGQRMDFLNDIADYLEQLVAMGFLGSQKRQLDADPVAQYIPCFVLLGHGIWFSRMMTALAGFLKDLKHQALALSPETQQAILGRFVRGSASDFEWASSPQKVNFELMDLPDTLRIAGGIGSTQQNVQTVLQQYGWHAEVENGTPNAAERLEFQDTAWQLSSVLIPCLTERKLLSQTEAKKLTPLVQQAILTIGCQREAFTQSEEIVSPKKISKNKLHAHNPGFIASSRKLLNGLSAYAMALGLKREKEIFDRLVVQMLGENSEE